MSATATTSYQRTRLTWVAFGALFAFGILNAALGPVLPYLRAAQGTSYLTGVLHQIAFALGGMAAGLQASRSRASRKPVIVSGLCLAASGGLLLGYGGILPATIAAAFLISVFATAALIRTWAVLADAHHRHRAVAMSEGEVSVSLAGIATPLIISLCATSVLGWQFSFFVAAAIVAFAVVAVCVTHLPAPLQRHHDPGQAVNSGPHHPLSTLRTLLTVVAVVALEWTLIFWGASYLDESVGVPQDAAVALVSVFFAASLTGRLMASRLARLIPAMTLLQLALATALVGTPILLLAGNGVIAAVGLFVTGVGIGATFPLAASLHVEASARTADQSMGQILTVAGVGQIFGPLLAGAIAEVAGLRAGLLILPALVVLAALMSRPRRR